MISDPDILNAKILIVDDLPANVLLLIQTLRGSWMVERLDFPPYPLHRRGYPSPHSVRRQIVTNIEHNGYG
jgi:hypothetical protein